MMDQEKTKEQLINELVELRRQTAGLKGKERDFNADVTEHEQAEEQAVTVLESVSDGFFACDRDWRFVYVNAVAERVLGIDRKEVLGRSHWEVFPLTLGTQLEREYRRAAAGEVRDFENFYKPWGRWFHNRCYPRKGGGMFVYFTDITERKQAEEALIKSREKYQKMFRSNPSFLLVSTLEDGRYVEANPAFEKLTGYNREEIIGKTTFELNIWADRSQRERLVKKLLKEDSFSNEEICLRTKSGSIRTVSLSCEYIELGGELHIISAGTDITELKSVQEELSRSKAQLEAIFNSISDAVIFADTERRIVSVNPAVTKLFGYTPEELKGKTTECLYASKGDYERAGRERYKVNPKAERHLFELQYRKKDGSLFPAESLGTRVLDGEGKHIGFIGVHRDISERKQTLEKIESTAKFPRENPNPVLRVGGDGTLLYANSGSSLLLQSLSWQVGRSLTDDWRNFIAESLESGLRKDIEVRCNDTVYSLVVVPIADSGYINLYGKDITERKQAEEALRESRAELEAALAGMTDAVFISDAEGRFIDFNDAFATFHRFRNKDECSKTFAEYPDILDVFMADGEPAPLDQWAVPRALRGETVTNAEYILRRKDTGETWVGSYSFGPIRDKDGVIVGSVVVGRDITEQKQAEEALREAKDEMELRVRERTAELARINEALRTEIEEHKRTEKALRESEQRFQEVMEHSLDAVYRRNLQTDAYDYMSPAMTAISGYTPEEMMSMPIETVLGLIHPDDLTRIESFLREILLHERKHALLEYRFKHRDGSYRWFSDLFTFTTDSQGQPLYRIGSVRDTTERKEAEERLKTYTVRLEQANRDLQDFSFVAAHDLQEPLRKIQIFSDLLKNRYGEVLNEQGRDYLERLIKSSNRMSAQIRDVLHYSMITSGAEPFSAIDLKMLICEVIAGLAQVIEKEKAKIEIAHLPVIEADPNQMQQLFKHLVENALRFRREERPIIKIYGNSVRSLPSNGVWYRIFVEDNGLGFDEQYANRIFTPFERIHENVKEGTGMGLAICRKIVERHGGTITAKSTPGKGSTFIIMLPVQQPTNRMS